MTIVKTPIFEDASPIAKWHLPLTACHPEPRLRAACNGIGLSLSLQYVYVPGTLNPNQKLLLMVQKSG